MRIEFSDEAGETFQNFVRNLPRYNAEITTQDGDTFDVELHGPDDGSQWYDAVRFKRLGEDDEPIDEMESARVEAIKVY